MLARLVQRCRQLFQDGRAGVTLLASAANKLQECGTAGGAATDAVAGA